jgi:hypothetical protein
MKYWILFLIVCVLFPVEVIDAQVPQKVSYQGLLTNASGAIMQDGKYDMKFEIFNLPSGGLLRYSETQTDVSVQGGAFNVILGNSIPMMIAFNESLFVEVTLVSGPSGPVYPLVFSPRSEFTSAPYAFRADTANYALSTPLLWSLNGTDLFYERGNISIGTIGAGSYKLRVQGRTYITSDIQATKFTDVENITYYIDPASDPSAVLMGSVDAAQYKDRDNTSYYLDPASNTTSLLVAGDVGIGTISTNGYKLRVAGQTYITDNIYAEKFKDATGGLYYVDPAGDTSALLLGSAFLFGSVNAAQFKDKSNPSYFLDPANSGTSLLVAGSVGIGSAGVIKSGDSSFIHNFGSENFFAGLNAGNFSMSGIGGNTGVGYGALRLISSANSNTAVGHDALSNNIAGNYNTAIGRDVLTRNTASSNTAVGYRALIYNTTGYSNTALGLQTLSTNTTGYYNVAIGHNALYSNDTGTYNTAVGNTALFNNNAGTFNTALGWGALTNNTTGTLNTAIGYSAGALVGYGALTNATAIGAYAFVSANNALVLGGTGEYAVHVGIGTTKPLGALDVYSTTGALIVPRMSTTQRDALTSINGMIIYNTTTNQFNFYENGAWVTK